MSTDVLIVSAARTPVGSFNGAFGSLPTHELGAVAIKGAMERAKIQPGDVDEVIMGQILSGGEGQNPARQTVMEAGIPQEKTALGPSSAVRACAQSRSACSRSQTATPRSSSPAAWSRC